MIVQDNEDVQKQVKKLVSTLENAVEEIRHLDKLADARYEEVDTVDEVAHFDKLIFKMRATMFNAKIELEKIQKAMHKHIAHTLNPIAKTAPKKEKSISARNKKGGMQSITIVHSAKTDTVYINGEKQNDLHKAVETIQTYERMNEIMPGKEGHHPTKKHSTINRNSIVPKGNAPQSNPAHDVPFDNDIPF